MHVELFSRHFAVETDWIVFHWLVGRLGDNFISVLPPSGIPGDSAMIANIWTLFQFLKM